MAGATWLAVILPTAHGMAKPGNYISMQEQQGLQPGMALTQKQHPELISLSEVAEGAFKALASDLTVAKGSSQWLIFLFVGVVVTVLAVASCVAWANRTDKEWMVASAVATVLPGSRGATKKAGGAGGNRSSSPADAHAPVSPPSALQVKTSGLPLQGWNRRQQVEKEEDVPAEEEVTQFRRWKDPSPNHLVAEGLQSPSKDVHFLSTPSFMPPSGVLSSSQQSKEHLWLPSLSGSAIVLGNPRPTPQFCEPQFVKKQGGSTKTIQNNAAESCGD